MKMIFKFEKKSYTLGELEKTGRFVKAKGPVIAFGPGLGKKGEAFAFTNEKGFIDWASKRPGGAAIQTMYRDIARARKERGKNEEYVKARQIAKARRVEENLRELAEITGLKYGSKALFLRATQKAPLLEGPVFDPAVLWTNAGFSGSALAAALPLPNLGFWPGFNNTITSVQVLGICVLYSGTFFGGASRVLVGVPYLQITNLGAIGFNNVTSSAYVYIY